jgi:Zn-dependent protease with chaperone function
MPPWLAIAWVPALLFALGFLFLLVSCWRQGRRLVSRRRMLATAAGLAALIAVPALPTAVLGFVWGRAAGVTRMTLDAHGEVVAVPVELPRGPADLFVVMVVWVLLLGSARQALRLPARLSHLHELAPPEPELLARVAALAGRLGVRAPQVVYLPGIAHTMTVQGVTAGLLVPAVVVTDGVCHRLAEAERDAILAHELGHVRNRSVLKIVAAWTVIGAAAVVASGWVHPFVAIAWAIAAISFVRVLLGWRDELAADRAAGRCVGHDVAAAALDRTHAAGGLLGLGRFGAWLHALEAHPGLDERAARLAEDAGEAVGSRIAFDAAEVRRARRVRRLALALWAVLLGGALALGAVGWTGAAIALACALWLAPLVPVLGFTKRLLELARLGVPIAWGVLVRGVATITAMVGVTALGLRDVVPVLPALACALLIGLLHVVLARRERRAARALTVLLHRHDLAGYLQRWAGAPRSLRRRAGWQLRTALVRAAAGDRREAIAELLHLHARRPRLRTAKLWAAVLLRDVDPDQGVALLRELAAALPGSPIVAGALAGSLLRAGRADDAWQQLQRPLAACPDEGVFHALAARCLLRQGDGAGARAALARGERFAPADPHVLLARAELQRDGGDAEFAETRQRLREQVARLPFAFLDGDLARLDDAAGGAAVPAPAPARIAGR